MKKLNNFQLFAKLCESITEASSSMNLISGNPGGKEVIRNLHQTQNLAHNQDYRAVDKIAWSELKDNYRGAWVIIQGSNGTGAIKSSGGNTGTYTAIASTGGEVKTVTDRAGGNIVDFLKKEIGKLQKFYVGQNTTQVRDLKRKRSDAKAGVGPKTVNQETLIKKFKPLWTKSLVAAIADIKGHISNQIRNDAFEKARKKLNQVETLQNSLEKLESGSQDIPDSIRTAVNTAVLMAASHHYPDLTGTIQRQYAGGYSSTRSDGPQKLLQDISKGDTVKLGTILGFFKRTLISG